MVLSKMDDALTVPARILVIPLRYIGDTVITMPLLRNLRYAFPQARIDVLASETAIPLLEECPYKNHVICEPASWGGRFQLMLQEKYDWVFLLRKSVTWSFVCKLAGVKKLVGYDRQRFGPIGFQRWGWFLDQSVPYPKEDTDTHQVLSHLNMLTACGVPVRDHHLELWETPDDVGRLESLFRQEGIVDDRPKAVIHAVTASSGKGIPVGEFIPAARKLYEMGYQVLCTGVPADAPVYEPIAAAGVPLINLAGKTTLRGVYSLFRHVSVLVSVDLLPFIWRQLPVFPM